jgi:intraflagellar transport protein 80
VQIVVDPVAVKKKVEEERIKEAQRPGAKRYA